MNHKSGNRLSWENQHKIIHESINRNNFTQEQYLNNPNKDNPKKKNETKPITKKNKTPTQILMKMKLKTWDMRWGNKNSYLFLEDLEVNKCKNGVCREWHEVFGWVSVKRESE